MKKSTKGFLKIFFSRKVVKNRFIIFLLEALKNLNKKSILYLNIYENRSLHT